MPVKLWRPAAEQTHAKSLLLCVASSRCLYVLLEGPAEPFVPPTHWSEHVPPPVLWVSVHTGSGVELEMSCMSTERGSDLDKGGRPWSLFATFEPPPNLDEALFVTLAHEDRTPIWEVQALPD